MISTVSCMLLQCLFCATYPLNQIFILLIPWPPSCLTYTGLAYSLCQTSWPNSIVYIISNEQSKSKAFWNVLWHGKFLRWGVVSTSPNPKLEDHPWSAVCDWLFNIFVANLDFWGSFLQTQHQYTPRRGNRDPLMTSFCHLYRNVLTTPSTCSSEKAPADFVNSFIYFFVHASNCLPFAQKGGALHS
jgi:hypothetical protein